MYFPYA